MNPDKIMSTVHELKCWPEYYDAIERGEKPFEFRKWDRPFKVGDILFLCRYDPETEKYTGETMHRKITYLLDLAHLPGDNKPHLAGWVALGLETPVSEDTASKNIRWTDPKLAEQINDRYGFYMRSSSSRSVYAGTYCSDIAYLMTEIDRLTAQFVEVTAERDAAIAAQKHGFWEFDNFDGDGLDYQCSVCGAYTTSGGARAYCSGCGAKMARRERRV